NHQVAEGMKMKGDLVVKTVRMPCRIIVRIAAIVTLLTVTLAWTFASMGSLAFASSIIETPTLTTPWGIAFDNSGHTWVAEPGCDSNPVCQSAFPAAIGEYNTLNVTLVQNYLDRKSTRLNSSHEWISYAAFCLKNKTF